MQPFQAWQTPNLGITRKIKPPENDGVNFFPKLNIGIEFAFFGMMATFRQLTSQTYIIKEICFD